MQLMRELLYGVRNSLEELILKYQVKILPISLLAIRAMSYAPRRPMCRQRASSACRVWSATASVCEDTNMSGPHVFESEFLTCCIQNHQSCGVQLGLNTDLDAVAPDGVSFITVL